MKRYLIAVAFFTILSGYAQEEKKLIGASSVKGEIFAHYIGNINVSEKLPVGNKCTVFEISTNKGWIFYTRLVKESELKGMETGEAADQYDICLYDIKAKKETVLFTTCHDKKGGVKLPYANTKYYNFEHLCGFFGAVLSPNADRLYFQSYAWGVCYAVHYYDFKTKSLHFFKAGDLHQVTKEGVVVTVTDVRPQGGRYWIPQLFNHKGEYIRTVGDSL